MKRRDEIRKAVLAELDRAGVSHGPVTNGGKHARMVALIAGRKHTITMALSPSEGRRARQNAVGQVRHMLRVAGILATRRATT